MLWTAAKVPAKWCGCWLKGDAGHVLVKDSYDDHHYGNNDPELPFRYVLLMR